MNNFDDIIKDKLENLIQDPPKGIWDKINASLPTSSFDNAINSKLSETEVAPPKDLWTKIESKLNSPFYHKPIFWYSAASVALLLIITSIFTLSQESNYLKHAKIERTKLELSTPIGRLNTEHNANSQVIETTLPEKTNFRKTTLVEKSLVDSKSKPNSHPNQHEIHKINPLTELDNVKSLPNNLSNFDVSENQQNIKIISETVDSSFINKEIATVLMNETSTDDSLINENKPLITGNEIIRNPRNINKLGAFVVFSPTYMKQELNEVFINSINTGVTYQNQNLIAEAGLGIGLSNERVNYQLDYERFEFVKNQFVTDSIAFVLDTTSNSIIPVGFGHQEDVYDDVYHTYNSTLKVNYTYLNIPLRFGYMWDFRRYSISLKAAINYNLVIRKSTSGMYELDEKSNLISMSLPEKIRYTNNFSYGLAAGVNMRLRKDLFFSSEIATTFSQNNLFSNVDASTKPFSINLNGGLLYYF